MAELSVVPYSSSVTQVRPLREIVHAFFRSRSSILSACLLFTIPTVTYLLTRKPSYESSITFLVKHARVSMIASPYADPTASAAAAEVTDEEVGTDLQLLKNRDLHVQVIRELNGNRAFTPKQLNRALLDFEQHLKIVPVPKTAMIQATYEGDDPAVAQKALAVLADAFRSEHIKIYGGSDSYTFFRAQADKYLQAVSEAQRQVSDFEAKSNVALLAEEKDIAVKKLAETRSSLQAQQEESAATAATARKLDTQLIELQPRIVTQQRTVPNQYSAEHLGSTLLELKNQRTRLLTQYVATDRRVLEVESEIRETEADLQKATQSAATEQTTDNNPLRQALQSLKADAVTKAAAAEARRSAVAQQVSFYEAQIRHLSASTGDYDLLQARLKEAQDNYALYQRKAEEGRITSALDREKIANVSIAEGPTAPLVPNSRLSVTALSGVLLGNVLLIALFIAFEMRRPFIYTPSDLERFTDIQVVATIPVTLAGPARGRSGFAVSPSIS